MEKINFQNLPNETSPIDAGNLNLLQDNVDNAKLEKSDVVNNLTTTSATKALSANQGKILNDKITQDVLYGGTDTATALNDWRTVTLSNSINDYRQIAFVFGTSGSETTTIISSSLHLAQAWYLHVASGYLAFGAVEQTNATQIKWSVKGTTGWSTSNIKLIKVFGIK